MGSLVLVYGGADRAPTPFDDLWVCDTAGDRFDWGRVASGADAGSSSDAGSDDNGIRSGGGEGEGDGGGPPGAGGSTSPPRPAPLPPSSDIESLAEKMEGLNSPSASPLVSTVLERPEMRPSEGDLDRAADKNAGKSPPEGASGDEGAGTRAPLPKPPPRSVDPLPRAGASFTRVGDELWLVGGQDPVSGIVFADAVALDVRTGTWRRPLCGFSPGSGGPPPPRHSHAAGLATRPGPDGRLRDQLVIVGGAGAMGGLSCVWLLDLGLTGTQSDPTTRTAPVWILLQPSGADGKDEPTSSGGSAGAHDVFAGAAHSPGAREMAASCLLPRLPSPGDDAAAAVATVASSPPPLTRLLVHGGRAPDGTVLSDACVLDLATTPLRWEPRRATRMARCAHSACFLRGPATGDGDDGTSVGRVVLFGGFSGAAVTGDVAELRPDTLGPLEGEGGLQRAPARAATGRFGHGAVAVPDPRGPRGAEMMVVWGGVCAAADLDETLVWRQGDVELPPEGAKGAAASPDEEEAAVAASLLGLLDGSG